MSDHKLMSMDD